jgi:hypothetical protein
MTEAQEMHDIHHIAHCSCLFRVVIFIIFWRATQAVFPSSYTNLVPRSW